MGTYRRERKEVIDRCLKVLGIALVAVVAVMAFTGRAAYAAKSPRIPAKSY
jgi:hypothetical protein